MSFFTSLYRFLIYWPLLLAVYFAPKRNFIFDDIKRDYNLSVSSSLQWVSDKYNRQILYTRLGKYYRLLRLIYPFDRSLIISRMSIIAGGVKCFHPFATIINAKSIGTNFTFRHCTTIGNKSDDRPDEIPIIGNDVTLGSNVCIFGSVTIGNNVIIGGGSVVVNDVPDNCVVAGNPAQIIKYIR